MLESSILIFDDININSTKFNNSINKNTLSQALDKNWEVLGIKVENFIVGYSLLSFEEDSTDLILEKIYVSPEYQRKGLGKKLFSEVVKYSNQSDFEPGSIKHFSCNVIQEQFLIKQGFKKVDSVLYF